MKTNHSNHRQTGASALTILGSLLIAVGVAGLSWALLTPVSLSTDSASTVPAGNVVAPTRPTQQLPQSAPVASMEATSGPHPNWHGTWQGTNPDSKMVITAAGVEIFDVRKSDGKVEKYHYMAPWGTKDPSGNGEESGYAKSSVSRAEILRAYEASVLQFRRDPSDFGISDPGLSRRFIGRIKPGNYRVVWADLGGDCGQRDMIVDDDLILSVSNCKYQHHIELFNRVR